MPSIESIVLPAKQVIAGLDRDGDSQAVGVIGAGSDTLKVGSLDERELLELILQQQKITNLHLRSATGEKITEEDV